MEDEAKPPHITLSKTAWLSRDKKGEKKF